jgi:uncharacterized protein DUF2795
MTSTTHHEAHAFNEAHTYNEAQPPARTLGGRMRSYSRISWGAVLAGAVVAGATMILLSLLGVAFGASGINVAQTTAADLKSYGVGAGIWGAINMILSMAFGGYVAARLSGTHSHLDGELHGITVWAVALLLATVLLARVVSGAIGTVATGAATAASGAISSASALTGSLAQTASPQALLDRLQQSLTSSGDPTQMTRAQITSEIAVLTGRRVLNGRFTDQERDRLNALVAVQAGITKEEAAQRVLRMEQDAATTLAQAEQQARAAADTAARGAALGAKALFSSLLLGLAAAMVGAWIGTRHVRVLHPAHEPAYDTHTTTYVTHHYDPAPAPTSVHLSDETAPLVSHYLQGVTFPATKQDLLRLAKANHVEPTALHRLEQVADRSYGSLHDLMTTMGAA